MQIPYLSKEELCKLFKCTEAQLNAQYTANAKQMRGLQAKAEKTGKKVHGYTAEQWAESAERFEKIANS